MWQIRDRKGIHTGLALLFVDYFLILQPVVTEGCGYLFSWTFCYTIHTPLYQSLLTLEFSKSLSPYQKMPPWKDFWFTSYKALLQNDCPGLPPGYQLLQHTLQLFANVTYPSAFYCIYADANAVNTVPLPRFSGLVWHYMLNVWHECIEGRLETHSWDSLGYNMHYLRLFSKKAQVQTGLSAFIMICNELFSSLLWYRRSAPWFTWLLPRIPRLCPYLNKNYLQQPFLNLMHQNHLQSYRPQRFYSKGAYQVRLQSQLVSRTYVISVLLPVSIHFGDPMED